MQKTVNVKTSDFAPPMPWSTAMQNSLDTAFASASFECCEAACVNADGSSGLRRLTSQKQKVAFQHQSGGWSMARNVSDAVEGWCKANASRGVIVPVKRFVPLAGAPAPATPVKGAEGVQHRAMLHLTLPTQLRASVEEPPPYWWAGHDDDGDGETSPSSPAVGLREGHHILLAERVLASKTAELSLKNAALEKKLSQKPVSPPTPTMMLSFEGRLQEIKRRLGKAPR